MMEKGRSPRRNLPRSLESATEQFLGLDPNAELNQRSGSPSMGLPPPGSMISHPSQSPAPQSILHQSYQSPHRAPASASGMAPKNIAVSMYGMQPPIYTNHPIPQGSFSNPTSQHQQPAFPPNQLGRMASIPGDMYNPPAANQNYMQQQQQRNYAATAAAGQPGGYVHAPGLPVPHGLPHFLGSPAYHEPTDQMGQFNYANTPTCRAPM